MSGSAIPISEVDLAGDFDPEAWDKKMAQMFDDEYYDQARRAAIDRARSLSTACRPPSPTLRPRARGARASPRAPRARSQADADYKPDEEYEAVGSAEDPTKGFEAVTARLKKSSDKKVRQTAQEYMDEYYALDYEVRDES